MQPIPWQDRRRKHAQREGTEPLSAPEPGSRRARMSGIGLSLCGLLCQLLFFWCLFWPYVSIFNPFENNDQGVTFTHTGWEVLMNLPFLIPLLMFPLILYLACLLSALRKKEWRRQWLEKSLYVGGSLNLAGSLLIFVWFGFIYSSADLYITASYDGAHLLIFLLLATGSSASSIVLGRLLWHSRRLQRWRNANNESR